MSIHQGQPRESTIDFNVINPDCVISENWLVTYYDERNVIWHELVQLNTNLFFLNKILTFPFHVFSPRGIKPIFWQTVFNNLFEVSTLSLWRIYVDSSSKTITIPKWKTSILKNLRELKYQKAIQRDLKLINYNTTERNIEKRIGELRNKVIGHLDREWVLHASDGVPQDRKVYIHELHEITKTINATFKLLCFGEEFIIDEIEYLNEGLYPSHLTDIDQLLCHVATDSQALYMPEEDPELWPDIMAQYSQEDIEAFNYYRAHCALPPV